MRAIVSSPTGPVFQEFEEPIAGPGFVKVRVKAAALNRADMAMLTGASHGVAGGMGMPLGLEWAGEVVEVGAGVEHISVGDRVMAAGPGAFCEYAVALEDWVYLIPDNMSYEQAAALPVALQTAHDAVASNGQLVAGQTVLIQGASSVVGLMAMQVAKLLGAGKVIGTSTTQERVQRLAAFGADQGINLLGQGVGGGRNQLRQRLGLREGGGLGSGVCLHPANALSATGAANRKFWTTATWSAAIKVGACPTPSNSTQRALGPRACMAWAVSRDSKSDCAPRSNSVWAWIWSYSCHSTDSPAAAASWVKARNGTAIAGS